MSGSQKENGTMHVGLETIVSFWEKNSTNQLILKLNILKSLEFYSILFNILSLPYTNCNIASITCFILPSCGVRIGLRLNEYNTKYVFKRRRKSVFKLGLLPHFRFKYM